MNKATFKKIAGEFYRANISIPIRFLIVSVICAAVLFFTGTFARDNTRVFAIIASAFLCLLTLWALVDVLIAPYIFKKRLEKEADACSELDGGLEKAHKIGKRWFFENHLLYFAKRRIQLIRYDEIKSADMKKTRLYLALENGKSLPFPFESSENPAILVAALRSKNEKMKATIDSKTVDFDKKKKKKGKRTLE